MNHAENHNALLFTLIALSIVLVSITHFLPTILAFWRGHYRRWTILFLNVIPGWTGVVWLYLLLVSLELF